MRGLIHHLPNYRFVADAFRAAVHRANVVVATGGLGPTPDDITRKTIATVFRRRLVLDETVLNQIRGRFRARGIEMPALNESQALIPRGARVIENVRGTAPGPAEAARVAPAATCPHAPTPAPARRRRLAPTPGKSIPGRPSSPSAPRRSPDW